ncbi:hypothetical protein GCM10027605_07310 [Micromonospora zhanjiangensis]
MTGTSRDQLGTGSAAHGGLRETGTGADMERGTRDELLGRLAEAVESVAVAHPTRVAVDGPPAAGKTTLADELAVALRDQGRDVIRATIDDFLFPGHGAIRAASTRPRAVTSTPTTTTR